MKAGILVVTFCLSFLEYDSYRNLGFVQNNQRPSQTVTKNATNWVFDKVKGSKILFKDGNIFETNLYDLSYIGQIKTDNYAPFLIYSGRDCNECDANIAIYFHSPRNGKLKVGHGENSYSYPGRELDYLDNTLIYESAAYYGEVIKNTKGIIWFENSRLSNDKFQRSVFLAKIADNKIVTEKLKDLPNLKSETLALNKAGKNKEIKGKEYTSEP